MKKLLIATAAIVSLAAGSAFAQDAETILSVNGTVAGMCGVGNQSGGGAHTPDTLISLGSLVDGNGQVDVAERTINFGNTWCNAPAEISMAVTQLTHDGSHDTTDTSSFVDALDMIVTPTSGGSIFVYFGGATEARNETISFDMPQAFETGSGTYQRAQLNVALPEGTVGNDRPLAGAYSGTITLSASVN